MNSFKEGGIIKKKTYEHLIGGHPIITKEQVEKLENEVKDNPPIVINIQGIKDSKELARRIKEEMEFL
jgi:hypothetical protein